MKIQVAAIWSKMSVVLRLRNRNEGVINVGLFHPEGYFLGKKKKMGCNKEYIV